MKKVVFFSMFISSILTAFSCSKTSVQTNVLAGNWNLVSDSSLITNSQNGFNSSSNYIGTAVNYYHFTANGNLYISKATSSDTATYTIINNSQVKLVYYYFNGISFSSAGAIRGTYTITNLTPHSATLTLSDLTPEGQELEIITLKK